MTPLIEKQKILSENRIINYLRSSMVTEAANVFPREWKHVYINFPRDHRLACRLSITPVFHFAVQFSIVQHTTVNSKCL